MLFAAAVTAYLGGISLTGGAAVGCGPDSGCDKVLQSGFAYWFGIPVSLLAVPIYVATAVCAFRLRTSTQCRRGWLIAVCGSLVIIGAGAWFVAVQLLIVKAFCPFCMSAHVAGVLGASLLLWSRQRMHREEGAPVSWVQVAVATMVGLGVMISGQFFYRPKGFAIANVPNSLSTRTNGSAPAATQGRVLPIYAGQFQLKVGELPIIGPASAAHLVVSLFDYTCHHCRTMHGVLAQVQRTFSNELAIVSLPMPLDPACNTLVMRTNPDHTNACEYARLGLAVWRARPTAHAAFDDWLFAPEHPPPVAEAQRYAGELVGVVPLQSALNDPWVNDQIQRDIAIYEAAYRARQGNMPQLIISNKVAVGTLPIENVYQLLAAELGLKAPGK